MRRIGMIFDHAARLSDESGGFDAVVYSMDAALYREHASTPLALIAEGPLLAVEADDLGRY